MSQLEIRGVSGGLLDDPFDLAVRGAVTGDELLWRARYRDDDNRIWQSAAATPTGLTAAWRPAKPSTGPVAALQSLRPVQVDVRVEARTDGRAAARTVTRTIVADGVRVRRWGGDRLFLPNGEPCATVVVEGPDVIAPALLASRGALVLALASGSADDARERLAAVPGAAEPLGVEPVVPPNVGGSNEEDVAAWDALIARLGARPRG